MGKGRDEYFNPLPEYLLCLTSTITIENAYRLMNIHWLEVFYVFLFQIT